MTHEEFQESRRKYLGASDAASVVNSGRYGCSRKLAFDKLGYEKDFDDSNKAEFSRGRRLEQVAADYYVEKTGRKVKTTTLATVDGMQHLAANLDRLVWDSRRGPAPGYLELKCVGRGSMIQIKKNGLIDDYSLQLQWGMAVTGFKWGSFGVYCPETDELIHWDVEADVALGVHLLEAGDDFFQMNICHKIIPKPLPEGSPPCDGCPWSTTCREGRSMPAPACGIVMRPELESLAAKYAELKGMNSEVSDASEEIREEILAAIGERPGKYKAGRFEFEFKIAETKRFSGASLKRDQPELYDKYRETAVTKTLSKPKEV